MDPLERKTDYDELCPKLSPRARRFLRLVATGMPIGVAAQQCCFSGSRATVIANSAIGQAYLASTEAGVTDSLIERNSKLELGVREAVLGVIMEEAPETLDRLLQLRDGDDARVALSASKDLLDRAGFKPKEQIEVEGKVLADAGLAEALARLAGLGKSVSEANPVLPAGLQAGLQATLPTAGESDG